MYYDGLCHLCSREMQHYFELPGARENIEFVDVSAHDFDARAEGLNPVAIHQRMHIKSADGQLRTGVEAFVELWQALPRYHWLAALAENPILNRLLKCGYFFFAEIRQWLPKRQNRCVLHARTMPLTSKSSHLATTP